LTGSLAPVFTDEVVQVVADEDETDELLPPHPPPPQV
jgi:hypothetical protein